MARLPRLVLPDIPYHVTQRGNRRAQTFFEEGDYALYRDLLAAAARKAGTEIWCYCLMPNHVHLILVPSHEDGLRQALADTHRRYTGFINARHRWTGHLWQGRFGAVAMDETHLAHAVRYVSLNPVRARLARKPEDWAWSSARAHMSGAEYGSAASTNIGRFQYTGQIWLPETFTYYYKARMYSPTIGRFLQTDPAGYDSGFNLYDYTGNDPLNSRDPTGMYICRGDDRYCAQVSAFRRHIERSLMGQDLSRGQRHELRQTLAALGAPGERNVVTISFGQLGREPINGIPSDRDF